ncbi:MAG: hypothetical protein O3B21_11090 [Proteobacteria bacterium]|nr:hypothetical protein [Pseudomonadota bacterium]MDA1357494.1 hypothetical protein [Pseudomonadota bacterium]
MAFLTCALAIPLAPTVTQAADRGSEETYRGVYLRIAPANPNAKSDIVLVSSAQALNTIRSALDLIYEKSPFNAKTLDVLKSRGDVVIIYDPAFPKWSRSDITLAAFLPNFFEPAHGAPGDKVFVAMLGRYIIKHSPPEIAAEGIVHELVGHGVQHMHGRLNNGNGLNIECEASLYEFQAFQDLGVDKFTDYMVQFRRELEEHHCDDFKRFMRKHRPKLMSLWDARDVDVIKILSVFDGYVAQLPN